MRCQRPLLSSVTQCKTYRQELKERRTKLLAAGSSHRSQSKDKKKKKKVSNIVCIVQCTTESCSIFFRKLRRERDLG